MISSIIYLSDVDLPDPFLRWSYCLENLPIGAECMESLAALTMKINYINTPNVPAPSKGCQFNPDGSQFTIL